MHHWMVICCEPTMALTCGISRIIVFGAFVVGIPNLVCEFLLGWRSCAYHFGSL